MFEITHGSLLTWSEYMAHKMHYMAFDALSDFAHSTSCSALTHTGSFSRACLNGPVSDEAGKSNPQSK